MWNTVRTVLLLIALVVVGLMAINFISNIVPILVTAVAAFLIGRLSASTDVVAVVRGLFNRGAVSAVAGAAAAVVKSTASAPAAKSTAEAKPAAKPVDAALQERANRLKDEPAPKDEQLLDEDFQVKTSEQIEAEARAREQELLQKREEPNPDAVQAALEARKKRLLGGDGS